MLSENSKIRLSLRALRGYVGKIPAYPIGVILKILLWDQLGIWVSERFYTEKYSVIEDYLSRGYLEEQIKQASSGSLICSKSKPFIWVFWWQGEDAMPEICKICYQSLLRHKNGLEVRLITKNNLMDFLTIPETIMRKLEEGKLSFTNFSDVVRCMLLAKFGGLWVDATLYFTQDIPLNWLNYPFFSIKNKQDGYKFVSLNRWSTFIMGGNGESNYFRDLANLMISYTVREDTYLEYMTIDYFMDLLFKTPQYKALIQNIPIQNEGLHELRSLLNTKYNPEKFFPLANNNVCFKLSYKMEWKTEVDGMETFYKHIRDEK